MVATGSGNSNSYISSNNNPNQLHYYTYTQKQQQRHNDVIRRGHSHNDYHQNNPLKSALLHGLRSVEVDVFPLEGELFVAHTRLELDEKKTIQSMYIEPILDVLNVKTKTKNVEFIKRPFPLATSKRRYAKQAIQSATRKLTTNNNNNKRINNEKQLLMNPKDDSLLLLVDFKADPNMSAKLLNQVIEPLKPYLSKVKDGMFHQGRVTIVISGNRPREESLYEYYDDNDNDSEKNIRRKTTSKRITHPLTRSISSSYRGGEDMNERRRQQQPSKRNRFFATIFSQKPYKIYPIPTKDSTPNENNRKEERYLFIDGRINDLYHQEQTALIPLISLNWSTVRLYNLLGKGDEYMRRCADLAHSQGKRLRIWGAPNVESVWRRMMRNNIDWLSIDDHERFVTFAMKTN